MFILEVWQLENNSPAVLRIAELRLLIRIGTAVALFKAPPKTATATSCIPI